MAREHRDTAILVTRPRFPGAVPIKLHAIFIRIAQIESFAHAVVGCAIERDFCFDQPPQGIRKQCAGRVEDRYVK